VPAETLKNKAYDMIKEAIVTCRYAPGSFLKEGDLCDTLGVSRTPIREALTRLERENMVRVFSKKGIKITEISLNSIEEVYQVRMLLEPYIIRQDAVNVDKNLLLNIHKKLVNVQNQDENWQYQLDSDLHQILINTNHNRYFLQTLANVYDQNQRIRIMSGRTIQERLEQTHREHFRLIEEILVGDFEKAAQVMSRHLAASREAAVRSMMQNS
jgi:DNA-binding GntR family transcriptional regulator